MYKESCWKGHVLVASSIVTLCLVLSGCVTAPHNRQSVCPGNRFAVNGYTQNPNAVIEIEALNDDTNIWERVRTTTSNSSGTTFGGDTAYLWATRVTLGDQHYSPFRPDAFAKLRVREAGGTLDFLFTFDQGGVQCVIDEVIQEGSTWFAAGLACRSDQSPEITLICIG